MATTANTQQLAAQLLALCESLKKMIEASPGSPAEEETKWDHVLLDWNKSEAIVGLGVCAERGNLGLVKFVVGKFGLTADDVRRNSNDAL